MIARRHDRFGASIGEDIVTMGKSGVRLAGIALTIATGAALLGSAGTAVASDSASATDVVDSGGALTDADAGIAPPEPSSAQIAADAGLDATAAKTLASRMASDPGKPLSWSLTPPNASGKRSAAASASDLVVARATDEDIPFAGWAACGARDDRFKVVHDYRRLTFHGRQERTYARLYCGLYERDGSTAAFGYRHIKDRHAGDWQRKADYIGRNWRDLAGWAMSYTFREPNQVYIQPTRFCYQRKFFLYYGDTKVSEMRAVMYLGETAVRVITAIPTNSGTCNGTKIYP